MAREVTPGFINAFGTVGLSGAWNVSSDQDQDEISDPNGADLRVLDGYNPREPLLDFARANGVTVQHTVPGRACVLAGTSAIFHATGATAEEAALRPRFAPLVNLGESPREANKSKGPMTRMGVAALVRKTLTEAQSYAAKRKADPEKTPINPRLEALLPALDRSVPMLFAAHRADDLRTALRIAEEFSLQPVLALGTEAFFLVDELAQKKIPVIVHPTMQRAGDKMETVNSLLATAALLKARGVPVALGTAWEGYVPKSRDLRSEAAMAAANGLGQAGALQAITLDAAKLLGIDKDYGSLAVGKVADLVLFDGEPFEHTTHITHTLVNGKVVYSRADYLALPFERRALQYLGSSGGGGCCLGW
jgi:imidazolonepropionase-like amidohydrolase